MAFTSTDVTNMETAIRELATGKVQEVTVNGRTWKSFQLADMWDTLDRMKTDVDVSSYGACSPIEFKGVDD